MALRDDEYTTYRLATVTPEGAVTAVQVASMDTPALFPADDGRVLLAGQFRSTSQGGPGDDPDWGYQLVDPATGQGTQTVVVPYPDDAVDYSYDDAALSPDGGTLYLFVSWSPLQLDDEPEPEDVTGLYAVDLHSGTIIERDLADDLDAVSVHDSGVYEKGLLARPDGGVSLVFDAVPSVLARDPDGEGTAATLPTLFFFDADLEPDGEPVQLADLDDAAETGAVAGTPDGTVFVQLEDRDGASVVAVPDAGGSGTELADIPDAYFTFGLVVEPAQEQAVIYGDDITPLDLTTGRLGAPLRAELRRPGRARPLPGPGRRRRADARRVRRPGAADAVPLGGHRLTPGVRTVIRGIEQPRAPHVSQTPDPWADWSVLTR